MAGRYIMVIDEGTTGTRALIVDKDSNVKGQAYSEFTQFNPAPDRVEHDAEEIWTATQAMVKKALSEAGLKPTDIAAVGITNQRATTTLWDRKTAKPITRSLVWQDTRTAGYIETIRDKWADKAYGHTGWALAPVYSSLSLHWMMENVEGARKRAEAGELAFGTIDSWLIYKLTGGKVHAVAASNATVTGSYDMVNDEWYGEWLKFLGVPLALFPEVKDDSGHYGVTDAKVFGAEIPITGAIGDQQAALFGQGCLQPGSLKCTIGTGTFVDMNVGNELALSKNGLNALIAWRMNGKTTYGLEGYAAVTGSAVQWLRDGAELIKESAEVEALATSVPDNGGVYFVPALTGLSAPYWDSFARGLIVGITRGTTRAHLVRATLEGLVYSIKVDGGAARNDFLMQMHADMLDAEVVRPINPEATSLGAAYMAGLAVGYWKSPKECFAGQKIDKVFKPEMPAKERDRLYADWTRAVKRSMGWVQQ
jgi:glycerol kinase